MLIYGVEFNYCVSLFVDFETFRRFHLQEKPTNTCLIISNILDWETEIWDSSCKFFSSVMSLFKEFDVIIPFILCSQYSKHAFWFVFCKYNSAIKLLRNILIFYRLLYVFLFKTGIAVSLVTYAVGVDPYVNQLRSFYYSSNIRKTITRKIF